MSAEPSFLDIATEEQLVAELAKRNAAVVVARIRHPKTADDEAERFCFDWRGGLTLCMGMVQRLELAMSSIAMDRQEAVDPDGDNTGAVDDPDNPTDDG